MTRQLVSHLGSGLIRNLANSALAANPADSSLPNGGWSGQWFGPGGAGNTSYVPGAGPNGIGVARKIWTTASTSAMPIDLGYGFTFPKGSHKPGQLYTFSMSAMSTWPTGHVMQLVWRDSSGATINPVVILGNGPTDTTARISFAAGQRFRLRGSAIAPAGVSHATLVIGPYTSLVTGAPTAGPAVGDIFDAFMPMSVEGFYDGDFSYGGTPGWVVLPDGTSAGFPYTLGRALGGVVSKLVENPTNGQVTPIDPIGPFAGRTIASVYDADGTLSANYIQTARLGTLGSSSTNNQYGGAVLQTGPSGSNNIGLRGDFAGGGSFNAGAWLTASPFRALGRHVILGNINDGMTLMRSRGDDQAAPGTVAITAGSGFSTIPPALVSGGGNDIKVVANVYIPRSITPDQEDALRVWLANRYQIVYGSPNRLDYARLDYLVLSGIDSQLEQAKLDALVLG